MKLEIVFEDGRKEHFCDFASFNVTEEQITIFDVVRPPFEGELFEVNPLGIDRSKFEKPMIDPQQEITRKIIRRAFTEVDKNPEKYASVFYTVIPVMQWKYYKSVIELERYAIKLGGLMADWVEQALEWAQRIFNGESWEAICNNVDTANWYRVISWNDGSYRIVGGSRVSNSSNPASYVCDEVYTSDYWFVNTSTLVVLKKK